MNKDVVEKIIEVLNSLIIELSPQMGVKYTNELFSITNEIKQMIGSANNENKVSDM